MRRRCGASAVLLLLSVDVSTVPVMWRWHDVLASLCDAAKGRLENNNALIFSTKQILFFDRNKGAQLS